MPTRGQDKYLRNFPTTHHIKLIKTTAFINFVIFDYLNYFPITQPLFY